MISFSSILAPLSNNNSIMLYVENIIDISKGVSLNYNNICIIMYVNI